MEDLRIIHEMDITEDSEIQKLAINSLNSWSNDFEYDKLQNFGSMIEVKNIYQYAHLNIRILTHFEHRKFERRSIPYRSGTRIEPRKVYEVTLKDLWRPTLINDDNEFSNKSTDYLVPNSSFIVECPTCEGVGRSRCYSCSGSGEVSCSCGNGKTSCSSCHGAGVLGNNQTCSRCGGSGSETCSSCGGSGRKRCSNCGGSGITTCSTCEGSGKMVKMICIIQNVSTESFGRNIYHSDVVEYFPEFDASSYIRYYKTLYEEIDDYFEDNFFDNNERLKSFFIDIQQEANDSLKEGQRIRRQKITIENSPIVHVNYVFNEKVYDLLLLNNLTSVYAPESPFSEAGKDIVKKAKLKFEENNYVDTKKDLDIAGELLKDSNNVEYHELLEEVNKKIGWLFGKGELIAAVIIVIIALVLMKPIISIVPTFFSKLTNSIQAEQSTLLAIYVFTCNFMLFGAIFGLIPRYLYKYFTNEKYYLGGNDPKEKMKVGFIHEMIGAGITFASILVLHVTGLMFILTQIMRFFRGIFRFFF